MSLPLQQVFKVDENEIAAAVDSLKVVQEQKAKMFAGMTWEERFHMILNDTLHTGAKLLIVVVVFIIGRWLIKKSVGMLDKMFERRKVDPSLRTFIRSLIRIVLYIVLFYFIIDYLGASTSLFVGLFSAAGLAIGMALSGVLQNFAGGVMILLLKPFRVGDWIEAQGQAGTVMDIRLFNTILRTSDNQTILLPNGSVSTSIVKNTNVAKTRRVEWIISLAYGDDFSTLQKVMLDLVKADPRVQTTPAPTVNLGKLAESSIDITVRCWVKSSDYWGVFFDLNAKFYQELPQRGFRFPYSTLDVNLRTPDDPTSSK